MDLREFADARIPALEIEKSGSISKLLPLHQR